MLHSLARSEVCHVGNAKITNRVWQILNGPIELSLGPVNANMFCAHREVGRVDWI
jgi:hypothetical protein